MNAGQNHVCDYIICQNYLSPKCWQISSYIIVDRGLVTLWGKGWGMLLLTCKLLKCLYNQYNDSHFLFASLPWPCFSYELKAFNQSNLITTSGTKAENSIPNSTKKLIIQQMRSCVPLSQGHRNVCILSYRHYMNSWKQRDFRCHFFEWTIPEVVRLQSEIIRLLITRHQ